MRFVNLTHDQAASACPLRASFRALNAPLLALALTSCDDAAGPAGGPMVRDSAGVRIVEYAETPQTDASFAFSTEPVYSYGGGSGDYTFANIWRGRLLPDGGVVVSDAGNGEVVLLAPDGPSSEILARTGEGPGEVGFVASMFVLSGDSVLLEDFAHARFTVLAGGSLARTVAPRDRKFMQDFRTIGIDPSGQLLMTSSSFRRGFEEDWLPGYMVRFDLDTEVADTVASYDWVPFRPPEGVKENPFPYFGVTTAAGGQFVYGREDVPELVWRNPDGSVRQIIRWQPEWVYPSEEHWNQFEANLRAVLPEVNPQASTDAAIEELIQRSLARYQLDTDQPLPLYGTPFGDADGRIWMAEHSIGSGRDGTPAYTVIAADGVWLGKVAVPTGLRVLDVAGGRVLGVVKDEMDVQSVVVYELVGP